MALVATVLDAGPAVADGPSFDCNRATTPNERMICADSQLRALDLELAQSYYRLRDLVSAGEADAVRDVQRRWLQDRQDCGAHYQCTITAYSTRTQQLQEHLARVGGGGSGKPQPPSWADGPSFDCTLATTGNEQLICSSAELRQLDLEMATGYYRLLEFVPSNQGAAMQDVQRRWLQDRQACGGDYSCTANAYDTRIQQLQSDLARFGG
jgi:uncharacterized protein